MPYCEIGDRVSYFNENFGGRRHGIVVDKYPGGIVNEVKVRDEDGQTFLVPKTDIHLVLERANGVAQPY